MSVKACPRATTARGITRTPSRRSNRLRHHRALLMAGCALASGGFGITLVSQPAAAQFVCVGNATGATVGPATADGGLPGANAAGSGENVACGTSANASSTTNIASNSAFGYNANASGTNAFNTALGSSSLAIGDGGSLVAIGVNANASGTNADSTAVGSSATPVAVLPTIPPMDIRQTPAARAPSI